MPRETSGMLPETKHGYEKLKSEIEDVQFYAKCTDLENSLLTSETSNEELVVSNGDLSSKVSDLENDLSEKNKAIKELEFVNNELTDKYILTVHRETSLNTKLEKHLAKYNKVTVAVGSNLGVA